VNREGGGEGEGTFAYKLLPGADLGHFLHSFHGAANHILLIKSQQLITFRYALQTCSDVYTVK